MYNSRVFKVLVLVMVSMTFLVGFKEKFTEKNQTGSPRIKKDVKIEVLPSKEPPMDDEAPINLENGPTSDDRRKFDGWYAQLEDKIRNKKTVKERVELLHQGLAQIEKDREQLQNLKFNEEIEIDFLIKPLKLMPKVSQFKTENCHDYKMKILSHFDPTSEDEVKDPSLKKALSVFKLICIN
ncbi:MAG: hypothetical protein B7Y39_05390 [Bdellovibrio sp. 28-41-41]|nr:MAG: hypothetical protein B7Y39_05390 [Bdellovibrio sp. 28-41-41]